MRQVNRRSPRHFSQEKMLLHFALLCHCEALRPLMKAQFPYGGSVSPLRFRRRPKNRENDRDSLI